MKVILTQEDIEQALIDFVSKLVTVQEGFEISVEKIIAGRGDKGLSAEVDISEPKEPEPEPVAGEKKPRKTRQRKATVETSEDPKDPPAEENKPEPEEKQDSPFKSDEVGNPDPEESQNTDPEPEPKTQQEPEPAKETPAASTEEAPKRPSIFARAQRPTNS